MHVQCARAQSCSSLVVYVCVRESVLQCMWQLMCMCECDSVCGSSAVAWQCVCVYECVRACMCVCVCLCDLYPAMCWCIAHCVCTQCVSAMCWCIARGVCTQCVCVCVPPQVDAIQHLHCPMQRDDWSCGWFTLFNARRVLETTNALQCIVFTSVC